ncbi:MAG TPA: hypothetical protein PLK67_05535 [Bryobacteraceae bacterium]|nr:hypothetical protein [Bryobacteraceae bacterium]
MNFGVVLDAVFLEHHNPPGHPERPERIETLITAFDGYRGPIDRFPPREIEDQWLKAVHLPEHVARIQRTRGLPRYDLDADTHTSARSYELARLAAGSAVALLDLMREGVTGQQQSPLFGQQNSPL